MYATKTKKPAEYTVGPILQQMVSSIENNVKSQIDLKLIERQLKEGSEDKRKTEIHLGMMERSKDFENKAKAIEDCKKSIKNKQKSILKLRN